MFLSRVTFKPQIFWVVIYELYFCGTDTSDMGEVQEILPYID
jgi:hypothetical protein